MNRLALPHGASGVIVTERKRILVVEDDATNVKVVAHMLAHLGYQHDAVFDGLQALEAIKNGSYGLVLMDCQMPRMDGWEATRLAREWQRANDRPLTPIVILSADISITDDSRFIELELDGFLAKPLRLKVLADTLLASMGEDLPTADGSPSGEPTTQEPASS